MTENQNNMKKEKNKRSTASKSRERSAEAPSYLGFLSGRRAVKR